MYIHFLHTIFNSIGLFHLLHSLCLYREHLLPPHVFISILLLFITVLLKLGLLASSSNNVSRISILICDSLVIILNFFCLFCFFFKLLLNWTTYLKASSRKKRHNTLNTNTLPCMERRCFQAVLKNRLNFFCTSKWVMQLQR